MTFDEFSDAVGIIAEQLPDELFKGLTGGVVAVAGEKIHEKSIPSDPLYVAGQYTRSRGMGCQILLYYGSFMRLYGRCTDGELMEHIKRVMLHELTHHWEYRSGERGLEIDDEERLGEYLDSHAAKQPERYPENTRTYTYGAHDTEQR